MKKQFLSKIALLAGLITLSLTSFSQIKTLHDPSNTFIMDRVFENNDKGILWWKCDSMKHGELFTIYKSHTGLSIDDEMVTIVTWDEEQSCLRHTSMRQHHKNIPVEGAEVIEHYKEDGTVVFTSGQTVDNFNLGDIPEISESNALLSALEEVNATTYMWEYDSFNEHFNFDTIDRDPMIYYPDGQLVYALIGDRSITNDNYRLAWKFNIITAVPMDNLDVYIDAQNGESLKKVTSVCSGDFNHIYYGNGLPLDTEWIGGLGRRKYYLRANSSGRNIVSQDNWTHTSDRWKVGALPEDKDDHWNNEHWGATNAHYVVTEAWDYFSNNFNYNGADSASSRFYVLANHPAHYDNNNRPRGAQFWPDPDNGNAPGMFISRYNSQTGPYSGTLDVAAHEFTHGIDHYNRKLEYELESGAIDESFADIFGYMSERRTFLSYGWTPNWIIGEYLKSGGLRDMQNPIATNQPNSYQQTKWFNTQGITPEGDPADPDFNDNGGVHINSGVQNRWFYLLSMGGIQNGTTVNGIGQEKAAKIAFYTLRNLVMPNETYLQIREHSIAAAIILYGFCSSEHFETCKAWKACNLGNSCSCIGDVSEVYCPDCVTTFERTDNGGSNKEQINQTSPQQHLDLISNESGVYKVSKNTSIYPNPTKKQVILDLGDLTYGDKVANNYKIEIKDMYGRLIYSSQIDPEQTEVIIDVESFRHGIYFLNISGSGFNASHKFMKQ